jgi:hypothetical protein
MNPDSKFLIRVRVNPECAFMNPEDFFMLRNILTNNAQKISPNKQKLAAGLAPAAAIVAPIVPVS